jgi:23S rRNA pseudouridine1911/1915/1917 synthase
MKAGRGISDDPDKRKARYIDSRRGKIRILFEDDYIIVVDKPAGLLTISAGNMNEETLYRLVNVYLSHKRRRERIFIVHRLDRDTSGVILLAKTYKEKLRLQDEWQTMVSDKIYHAVVEGSVKEKSTVIRSYLTENNTYRVYSTPDKNRGKEAVSRVECVKSGRRYSLLRVRIETGRKNQIRVHLSDYCHPVAGDKKYGAQTNPLHRLCLHASGLVFTHPATGEKLTIESTPPAGFSRIVES